MRRAYFKYCLKVILNLLIALTTLCNLGRARACGAHSFQLICPFARTNSCIYSFVHASIRLWNKLPTSIAQVTSYTLFKKLAFVYVLNIVLFHCVFLACLYL